MFMLDGGIFCASWADVSATSSVSQIALLLPAVESEAYTLTFRSVRLFSESTEDMILQVFQQNNHSTATCHSIHAMCDFTVAAGSQLSEKEWGEVSPGHHYSLASYIYFYIYL